MRHRVALHARSFRNESAPPLPDLKEVIAVSGRPRPYLRSPVNVSEIVFPKKMRPTAYFAVLAVFLRLSLTPGVHGLAVIPSQGRSIHQFYSHPVARLKNEMMATVTRRRCSHFPSSALSMHYGHSHSHHHHEHPTVVPDDLSSHPRWQRPVIGLIRRPVARLIFSLLVTLLAPAVIRAASSPSLSGPLSFFRALTIRGEEIAAFIIVGSVLTLSDKLRSEFRRTCSLVLSLRDHLVQYSVESAEMMEAEKENDAGEGGSDRTGKILRRIGSLFKTETDSTRDSEFEAKSMADCVILLGLVVNFLLTFGKAFVGIACRSSALIADAGHSLSDIFSDFVTIWAVQIGRLPPDDEHPYGHGKFEAIGSLFLAFTLIGTGLSVGHLSNRRLWEIIKAGRSGAVGALVSPTKMALAMAGISIISKEWLYRITRKVGERINSPVIVANAWHHRSDAYSSVLALISIALAISFPTLLWMDAAAGILVAGMICMTGTEIMADSVTHLTDTNDVDLVHRVEELAKADADVEKVMRVRSRKMGSTTHVDLKVAVKNSSSTIATEETNGDATSPINGSGAGDMASSAMRAVEERIRWRILGAEQEQGVYDVDVHAEVSADGAGGLNGENGTSPATSQSASAVEEGARRIAAAYPNVRGVGAVTVRYTDSMAVHVDMNLRLMETEPTVPRDVFGYLETLSESTPPNPEVTGILSSPDSMSISRALQIAGEVKKKLESQRELKIESANIFLDLNEKAVEPVSFNSVKAF
mmetsp:Transcript_30755/g.70376  ORF Transcript_30755/g.70376 Transcript_30755/m.70376 type:complete len:757 (-) Transcript_30755:155-2425(-)